MKYTFYGKRVWRPPSSAMPIFFLAAKSWGLGISFEVSLVSVLAMVLSENWKRLEKIFRVFWQTWVMADEFFQIDHKHQWSAQGPTFWTINGAAFLPPERIIEKTRTLTNSLWGPPHTAKSNCTYASIGFLKSSGWKYLISKTMQNDAN